MQLKKILLAMCFTAGLLETSAQKIDSSYNNTYYQGRMELFRSLPVPPKAIVFLGNSITERGMWHELLPGKIIMNRGIGGDNTFGVLARLPELVAAKPSKLFLMIGINDIGRGLPVAVIANNYRRIIQQVRTGSPKTKLFLQSVLPMNDDILKAEYLKNKMPLVRQLNDSLRAMATEFNLSYIDLHNEVFKGDDGQLKPAFTADGIHIVPAAYVQWVAYLKKKKYL
ncbi:MAG: GDSL-type esterase/lipase family protein [Chitinophagaceae bacterium]